MGSHWTGERWTVKRTIRCLAVCVGLVGTGCVSAAGQLGMPASASPEEIAQAERLADLALASYLERDGRLQEISQRLRVAGADLCEGDRGPVLGAALSSRKDTLLGYQIFGLQLPPGYSQAAERRFPDARPRVVEVFEGLPASRAGLQVGDVVVSIDGDTVRDRYEIDRLTSGAGSSVELGLEREGRPISATLERVEGCAYPSYLLPEDQVNAFAYSPLGFTAYTSALVRELRTDTQLALVVGHEMGHQIISRLNAASPLSSEDNEARADYIGAYMTASAGYPLSGADSELFDVLTRGDPSGLGGRGGPRTHPLSSARTLALKQAVDEIRAKQARGEPLRPEAR